jgi:hypothetical protein
LSRPSAVEIQDQRSASGRVDELSPAFSVISTNICHS